MAVKLLTEHHLEFRSLKGGYRGSSESTLVKMPHSWKSHVAAHFTMVKEVVPSGNKARAAKIICHAKGPRTVLMKDCP